VDGHGAAPISRVRGRDVTVGEHRDALGPVSVGEPAEEPAHVRLGAADTPWEQGEEREPDMHRRSMVSWLRSPMPRPDSLSRAEPRRLTARTAAVTASSQIVTRGLTLLLTVAGTAIVTRTIGEDGFAVWGTVLVITAMVAFLLDPGVAPVVVRRLAQKAGEAPAPRPLLAARFVLATAAYLMVIGLTVALRGNGALLLAVVLAAQLLPRAIVMNVGTWMQANHRLHVQTGLEALTAAGGLIALVVAAALGATRSVLAAVGVLAPALVLAALMEREMQKIPARHSDDRAAEWRRVRSVLLEAAPLAAAIVLLSIYTRIGIVFVNEAESEEAVGRFTLAFLFIEQVLIIASIIAGTLLPMLAARTHVARPRSDPVVHDLLAAMTTIGAGLGVGLIALAEPLVLLVGGKDFEGTADLVRLLAPTCAALFANIFVAYVFVTVRRAGRYLVYNLVGLAVSLCLGALFTLQQGADAAARVTWITELVVVTCAALPFFWGDPGGRRALVEAAAAMMLVIACSEASVEGVLPVGAAGGLGAIGLLVLAAPRVRRWRHRLRSLAGRPPAVQEPL
jgi:O-antigen/teichoic acid export membrane protein